ncbi:MAG: imidazole glycerol phosphate synthase subunit HisH [Coriobacteriales bacterium]|nr:imidazole glycerol phosphate synthase subunit HisH [Coriobacteriales bacterium]
MSGYIAVVDYHKGNLLSVEQAVDAAGGTACVTDALDKITQAQGVIVPGVGAFADAMEYMEASGQAEAIKACAQAGVPILGICLGMQLLFERGNEHAASFGSQVGGGATCAQTSEGGSSQAPQWVAGLGLLGGEVVRMEGSGVKVPHMGWNSAMLTKQADICPLWRSIEEGTYFYFTHSYVCEPLDPGIIVARTEHALPFVSAIWDGGRIFGCQFHPEKSSGAGARIISNFVRLCEEG